MSRQIPVDLYPHIFQHIQHAATLSNLCAVSRTVGHEAERVLYHTVRLPGSYRRISAWCKVIIENPRFANIVHTLTLPASCSLYGRPVALADPEVLKSLVRKAFLSISKLRELYTYRPAGRRYLDIEMLLGCPFQLLVVGINLPTHSRETEWRIFLREQREIQHWSSDFDHHIVKFLEPDMLPMLKSVRISFPLLNFLLPRPISALEISGSSSRILFAEICSQLGAYGHTLTRLNLDIASPPAIEKDVPGVIKTISDAAPNLQVFSLRARISLLQHPPTDQTLNFLSALSTNLPLLDTLILMLPAYSPTHPFILDEARLAASYDSISTTVVPEWVDSRPKERGEALAMAVALMNANASLKRVAFEVQGSWASGRFACFSSAQGVGDVVFEGFDILVPESWRDC